jgi:hypothetical protein
MKGIGYTQDSVEVCPYHIKEFGLYSSLCQVCHRLIQGNIYTLSFQYNIIKKNI